MTLRIISDQGLYEVDTELPPRKWLAQCPRMEAEGVVFLAFDHVANYGPDGIVPALIRLGAVESIPGRPAMSTNLIEFCSLVNADRGTFFGLVLELLGWRHA